MACLTIRWRMGQVFLVAALSSTAWAEGAPSSEEGTSAAESVLPIEREALAVRRALSTCDVTLNTRSEAWSAGESTPRVRARLIRLCLSGGQFRCDVRARPEDRYFVEHPEAREVSVWGKSDFYHFPGVTENGEPVLLKIRALDDVDQMQAFRHIDPRKIGMLPDAVLNLCHAELDSFLGSPARHSVQEETCHEAGRPLTKVSISMKQGMLAEYWIDSSRAFSVTKASITFSNRGARHSHSVVNSLRWHESSKWFPDRVEFEHRINDRVVMREVSTIERASLNEPIDEGTFTLAGMNSPAGWPVDDRLTTDVAERIWDGGRVTSIATLADQVGRSRRFTYWVGAWIAAGIATLVSWRFFVGLRRTTST